MKTNIALYQESLKSDQVDYETPYESVATDFYQELITGVIENSSARILDLGCFKGILVDKLSDYSTVGLDVTTAGFMKQGKYVLGTGEQLPFKDDSFDCVAMTEVIEHILEPERVFVEIRRILKDGGYLLITHPNKYNLLDETLEWFKENRWIRKMLNRPIYQGVQHVQSFYYSDTIKALQPFHFNIHSRHALTFSLFRLFSIFVYGRFKWDNSFEFLRKFIKGERFVIQRLGRLGQLLSGSCIMLFQLKKTGFPPLTPHK